MSTNGGSDGGSFLVRLYEENFGEARYPQEAYGYWMFVVGWVLGVAALGLFLWSTSFERGTGGFWAYRRMAVLFAGVSFPVIMTGVVLRLPVRRTVEKVAVAGAVVCFVGLTWFVDAYPANWNLPAGSTGGPDYTAPIVAIYGFGALVLVASALVIPFVRDVTLETRVTVAASAEYELYEDDAGEWRWRLRHRNGEVIADSGEGYTRKENARKGIDSVRENAMDADHLEFDPTGFEIYEDEAGDWRWRLRHRNGNVLADGGEGYSSRSGVNRAVENVREAGETEVYEDEAGEYRWRMEDGGDVVADSGEGYSGRDAAEEAAEMIESYVEDADTLERNPAAFEIFEDSAGEWRWRLRHRNGNVLADGGEGYSSRSAAVDAVESVRSNAGAEVTEL